MGSGKSFHGALSTKGGLQGAGEKAAVGTLDNNPLVKELQARGTRINVGETLFVAKDKTGMIVWLEKGNPNGGLHHILDGNGKTPGHAADFQTAFGISRQDVPGYIKTVVTNGNLVSSKTVSVGGGRLGYERIYYYNGNYHLVTGIGTNGFIVTAYPIKIKK